MNPQWQGPLLITKTHQLGGRLFARKLKEHDLSGITPAQFRILFELWRNNGISIFELAQKTSLGKSTLTSMLDRLEDAGYLSREHSQKDRRKILIWSKKRDKALELVHAQISNEISEIAYKGLTVKEIETLEKNLHRVLDNLTIHETSKG